MPRKPETIDPREALLGYAFAVAAFGKAEKLLDFVVSTGVHEKSPLFEGMVIAIAVLYARPFHNGKGLEKLDKSYQSPRDPQRPKNFVPLKVVHDQLWHMRQWQAAHYFLDDAVRLVGARADSTPPDHVEFIFQGGRVQSLHVPETGLRASILPGIKDLLIFQTRLVMDAINSHIQSMTGPVSYNGPVILTKDGLVPKATRQSAK